jgi:hypothetical protein
MKHDYLVVLRITAESKDAARNIAGHPGKVEKIYQAASTTLPSEELVDAALVLREGPANHIRATVSGPGWKLEFEQ